MASACCWGAALALGLAWIVGAAALQTPGLDLRRDVQRSKILAQLNAVASPSGRLLNALARFDPLPQLSGPGVAGLAPPTPAIGRDPDVEGAAAAVVRVLGDACGLSIEGSGWVAGRDVVVTNAHVVAGQDDTVVERRGAGAALDARVVYFNATDDVAVLRVDGLSAPALGLAADASAGTAAAVLGFPATVPTSFARRGSGRRRACSVRTPTATGPCAGRWSDSGDASSPATPADRSSTRPAAWSARSSRRARGLALRRAMQCPTPSSPKR